MMTVNESKLWYSQCAHLECFLENQSWSLGDPAILHEHESQQLKKARPFLDFQVFKPGPVTSSTRIIVTKLMPRSFGFTEFGDDNHGYTATHFHTKESTTQYHLRTSLLCPKTTSRPILEMRTLITGLVLLERIAFSTCRAPRRLFIFFLLSIISHLVISQQEIIHLSNNISR